MKINILLIFSYKLKKKIFFLKKKKLYFFLLNLCTFNLFLFKQIEKKKNKLKF